jgi:hypothetical protein
VQGTRSLIVFGVRLLHPLLWEPLMPEEIPTGHVSDAARTPAEVVSHVRWFGTAHTRLSNNGRPPAL